MRLQKTNFRIGLRTLKTVIAVLLSMIIVDHLGTTSSKLIFAMLGAMAAVQPTFKESLDSCLAQIVGVILGAIIGVFVSWLLRSPLLSIGIGMIVIIAVYNLFQVTYSPSLPCFILVMLCTSTDIAPFDYALGRIWDTTVGLLIGFVINIMILPYDTSKDLRIKVTELVSELQRYLEDLFDGDNEYPATKDARNKISEMTSHLRKFEKQKLVLHLRRQKQELALFHLCEEKAQLLLSHIEVLHSFGNPGALSPENRRQMEQLNMTILDARNLQPGNERDIITNYHVTQLLLIRDALSDALKACDN